MLYKLLCTVRPTSYKKIVRHLPLGYKVAPAVKEHKAVIRYKNCQVCNIGDLPLTSTSTEPSPLVINSIINIWNKNFLNPTNRLYDTAYENIFMKDSRSSLNKNRIKFISLFYTDHGVVGDLDYPWLQVFDAIIDTDKQITPLTFKKHGYETGYAELYKESWDVLIANTTHNTFIIPGSLNKVGKYRYKIASTLAAFSIRHQGATKCNENFYDKKPNTQEYDTFGYIDAIENLMIKLCKAHNKTPCNMEFVREIIKDTCNRSHSNFELAHNDIASVTCDNYEDYLAFYEKQQRIFDDTQVYTESTTTYDLHYDDIM